MNHYRVDVDAGFDGARNAYSVGTVIRDHLGHVVGAKAQVIRHPGIVKCAELAAILFGLRYCVQLEINIAHIFSDSFSAVKGVIQNVEDCGPEGILLWKYEILLHSMVQQLVTI